MSDSEGSALTDLEEDELDNGMDGPTTRASTKAKKGEEGGRSGGYRIKGVLPIPRATTYTAGSLYGASAVYISRCDVARC